MEVDLPGWLVVTAIVHSSTEGFIPQVVASAIVHLPVVYKVDRGKPKHSSKLAWVQLV